MGKSLLKSEELLVVKFLVSKVLLKRNLVPKMRNFSPTLMYELHNAPSTKLTWSLDTERCADCAFSSCR